MGCIIGPSKISTICLIANQTKTSFFQLPYPKTVKKYYLHQSKTERANRHDIWTQTTLEHNNSMSTGACIPSFWLLLIDGLPFLEPTLIMTPLSSTTAYLASIRFELISEVFLHYCNIHSSFYLLALPRWGRACCFNREDQGYCTSQ
jgi:hypothetical protein